MRSLMTRACVKTAQVLSRLSSSFSVPLNQRPRQHERRTVFNDHNQQSQTNKQFDLKYKETTLALGLTNIQNKREINWNSTKNLLL